MKTFKPVLYNILNTEEHLGNTAIGWLNYRNNIEPWYAYIYQQMGNRKIVVFYPTQLYSSVIYLADTRMMRPGSTITLKEARKIVLKHWIENGKKIPEDF
jgi:hypothetical protein